MKKIHLNIVSKPLVVVKQVILQVVEIITTQGTIWTAVIISCHIVDE